MHSQGRAERTKASFLLAFQPGSALSIAWAKSTLALQERTDLPRQRLFHWEQSTKPKTCGPARRGLRAHLTRPTRSEAKCMMPQNFWEPGLQRVRGNLANAAQLMHSRSARLGKTPGAEVRPSPHWPILSRRKLTFELHPLPFLESRGRKGLQVTSARGGPRCGIKAASSNSAQPGGSQEARFVLREMGAGNL